MPENGRDEGGRTQPEFALGERAARLEALIFDLQPQLDRRFGDAEKLNDEKLDGVRREIEAKATAQREAVDKAERATTQQFETFVEANDKKADVTQSRLAALERGESLGIGARKASSDLKTSTLAWIGAAIAFLSFLSASFVGLVTILVYLLASHTI